MTTQKQSNHMELIGQLSAAWALLEANIELTISLILKAKISDMACVTSQFGSYYPKLKAVIALLEKRGASPGTIKYGTC